MSELEPELPVEPSAPADVTPAADPTPPASAAPEPPAAAPINWEDQSVLAEAAARIQALGYTIGLAQPEPTEPAALPEYDPYNPQPYFDARDQMLLDRMAEQFGPVQQFFQSEQDQRVEGQITGQIDTLKTELGYDGDTRDLRALADAFAPEMVAKFGQTPAAGQAAIRAAIEHAKARDEAIGQKAVEAYKESLKNPGDSTPYEPGVRGSALPNENAFTSEADVARAWRDRQPV